MIKNKDKHKKKIKKNFIKCERYTKKYFAKRIIDEIN